MTAAQEIAQRLTEVRGRIERACERADRDPSGVTLVAVSKSHGSEAILAAFRAGVLDFGENRVQEALPKFEQVRALLGDEGAALRLHLIGHLQTNKVRAAVKTFAILQSVDSERLLRAIDAAAAMPMPVLLEVNVSGEASKYGVSPGGLGALVACAEALPNIRLDGLMTVAPQAGDPDDVRPVFRLLAELAGRHELRELSMGMTEDYEVAIEEGATIVRIGRAIFGERTV